MVISPNQKEYDEMIEQLKTPTEKWLGPGKEHIGFYDMELNPSKSINGQKFVDSSYCYPEQNYLTKRYSGKWTYIEYSFQSWSLDPCNSFGIHMAAFNPKPWFKQPANSEIKAAKQPFHYFDSDIFVSDIPKAVVLGDENIVLENISISYELFNDLIIWGLVELPDLVPFFVENTKIYGTKLSFGEDIFKPLSDKHEFKLLKYITKTDPDYKKLSISQQYISNLLNDYVNFKPKVKDKYLSICHTKIKDRYGEYNFDPKIITYPGHIDKSFYDKNQFLKHKMVPIGKLAGYPIEELSEEQADVLSKTREFYLNKQFRDVFSNSKYSYMVKDNRHYATLKRKKTKRHKSTIKRRSGRSKRRLTKKKNKKQSELIYFKMDGCHWCNDFEDKLLPLLKHKIRIRTINGPKDMTGKVSKYGIKSYPSLVKIENNKHKLFSDNRTVKNIMKFMS